MDGESASVRVRWKGRHRALSKAKVGQGRWSRGSVSGTQSSSRVLLGCLKLLDVLSGCSFEAAVPDSQPVFTRESSPASGQAFALPMSLQKVQMKKMDGNERSRSWSCFSRALPKQRASTGMLGCHSRSEQFLENRSTGLLRKACIPGDKTQWTWPM